MLLAVEKHDCIMSTTMQAHGGYIFKTMGDAFLVAFPTSTQALAAAIESQRRILQEDWQACDSRPVKVRMALHVGDAQLRNGDYFGVSLARTDRILKITHGGQILASEAFCAQIVDKLPDDVSLLDLKFHRLKDLNRPEHIFQVNSVDRPSEFPPLHSLDVVPNNLPVQLTSFVGRAEEMKYLCDEMKSSRLVTLLGSGGSGKTRLALQIGAELLDEFRDGVWFVDLSALTDSASVVQAVAKIFGVGEQAGRPLLEILAEHLASKQVLILLDNCEHLVAASAQLAETLLTNCPDLKIIATSREHLGVGGEKQHSISALTVPSPKSISASEQDTSTLLDYEAVRLFMDRAILVNPRIDQRHKSMLAVVSICHRLDGIPLAIELAAALVSVLTPLQILPRMTDFFRLLNSGTRTAMPRHQTLRNTILWSFNLLQEPEKVLLRRLSVFQNGWTLEAMEAVCPDATLEDIDSLPALSALVQKYLVKREEGINGESRYRMLETIRQFGQEQLQEAEEDDRFKTAHRDYFLGLAEEAEPHLKSHDQKHYLELIEMEHDNIRSALAWSTDGDYRLRIASAMHRFWLIRGYLTEGKSWLEGAIDRKEELDLILLSKSLNATGIIYSQLGNIDEALSLYQRCLVLKEQLNDSEGIAAALNNMGYANWIKGNEEEAIELYRKSAELYRKLNNLSYLAVCLSNVGAILLNREEYTEALKVLRQAEEILRQSGEPTSLANALHNLGVVEMELKDYDQSIRHMREALTIRFSLNSGDYLYYSFMGLAQVFCKIKDSERSVKLFAVASRIREESNNSNPESSVSGCLSDLQNLRNTMDEKIFAACWNSGYNSSLLQALDLAQST